MYTYRYTFLLDPVLVSRHNFIVLRNLLNISFTILITILFLNCKKTNTASRPPNKPAIPSGPSTGAKNTLYTFTTITTDPDKDGICYRFDWGDGDTSDWTPWVQSGSPGSANHCWTTGGAYSVRAQAKDVQELTSDWSEPHQIAIVSTWSRTFGGTQSEWGSSVRVTADGGYIIAGSTASYGAGSYDVYLIKCDTGGHQKWSKTFGGGSADYGSAVEQTEDGGYIITGYTHSFGLGNSDVYLIKTDVNGNEEWTKTFGGSGLDDGYSVAKTKDGGYLITGGTNSYGAGFYDVYLIKVDAQGNLEWDTTYGGAASEWGSSVQEAKDGNYIIAGSTLSYGEGSYDVLFIKTTTSGRRRWLKTFGGPLADYGTAVQETRDGGYIIAGYTYSFGAGGSDVYLVKTDALGNQEWAKTFGGSDDDGAYAVQETEDGGYIIVGWTESYGAGRTDVYLIKTDASGNMLWSKTYGGLFSDYGSSVQKTMDEGYIITGCTYSYGIGQGDVYLIKTDASGNTQNP